jgi:hypothetical protein
MEGLRERRSAVLMTNHILLGEGRRIALVFEEFKSLCGWTIMAMTGKDNCRRCCSGSSNTCGTSQDLAAALSSTMMKAVASDTMCGRRTRMDTATLQPPRLHGDPDCHPGEENAGGVPGNEGA